jgi:hypothetical protein
MSPSLKKLRAASLAVGASVLLVGATASPRALASEDPIPPVPSDTRPPPCFLLGQDCGSCHGYTGTVNVPPGGANFYAPPGDQVIIGTAGGDRIFAEDDDDVICGGGGIDVIYGGAGDDYIYGDGEGDQIYGDEDDDWLFGGSGPDVLSGDDDDDVLYGEGAVDGLGCGSGYDTADGGAGAAVDFILPNSGICENITAVP